jgi:hypothetical protein
MCAARARRSSGKKGNKKEMWGLQKKRGLRIKRPAANTKKNTKKKYSKATALKWFNDGALVMQERTGKKKIEKKT